MFVLVSRTAHNFANDEFFAELRNEGVSHVGQVQTAILETNGKLSIFFYPDTAVRPGLPVLPNLYNRKSVDIAQPALYACTNCGDCEELAHRAQCSRCGKDEWVLAIDNLRIT